MSYTIIYDKQFIKLSENQFVPMILAGSNNCTEFTNGRERRERSWFPANISNKLIYSKKEFIDYVDNRRKQIIEQNDQQERDKWFEEYSDNSFGYWDSIAINGSTRNTTFGEFKGLFTTGCNKALTIETLKENYVSVSIENSFYTSEEQKQYGLKPYCKIVNSSEEFVSVINEFNEIFKGTNLKPTVRFNGMNDKTPKRLRLKYFAKKRKLNSEKKEIKVNHYFTIIAPNDQYFVKRLKFGYKYTYYPYLKIMTETEVNRKLKVLGPKYKMKKIDEVHTFYK